MKKPNKKGEGLGIVSLIMTIVLIGVMAAVGLVMLVNLENTSAVTGDASTAINDSIDALAEIPSTWLGIIVTVAILGVLLMLIFRVFKPFARG